jgi:uncharacterized membrane protein YphA (DoxX/SURF4 family)
MKLGTRIDRDAIPYALGAIGLGVVTLIFHDFLLQWQPVPQDMPLHGALAMLSGVLLIAAGAAVALPGAGTARLLLPSLYLLWVLGLHGPVVVRDPSLANLLGLAEILSLATAGSTLVLAGRNRDAAVRLFGLCPLVFGFSHIAYAGFTAQMVPGWIPPGGLFWAGFTGAAHIAAGLAIVTGIGARVAAACLAAMCACFVLLLHLPRVIAAPTDRLEWTMLLVSLSIAGAAWLVRRATA